MKILVGFLRHFMPAGFRAYFNYMPNVLSKGSGT